MWKDAEQFLLKDGCLAPLIKTWGHCKIKPIKNTLYFEDLVDAICSQQLSGKAAKTIFNRVKEALGGKFEPDLILKTKDQKLRDCGLSWGKVSYVKDLAKKVKDQEVKVKILDKLPDEEVIKELVAVKGIGRWTAEMFLMFSLARPDVFPLDDLGIKKGLRLLRGSGSERFEKAKNDKEERVKMAEFADKNWKPYRTVASWYLWRSLENR